MLPDPEEDEVEDEVDLVCEPEVLDVVMLVLLDELDELNELEELDLPPVHFLYSQMYLSSVTQGWSFHSSLPQRRIVAQSLFGMPSLSG